MNKMLKAKIVEVFGTQADFAAAIRIDETIVSRVICGRRDLPDDKKKLWARVLGSSAKKLFSKCQVDSKS